MFCSKCGNEIPEGANLCGYCGTPVNRTADAGAQFHQEGNGNASNAYQQGGQTGSVYGESAPNYAGQAPYNGQPYPINGYQTNGYETQGYGYGAPVNHMDGGAVGFAITSMILGIISLLLSCCINIWWLIVICAVLGIIFGAVSLAKRRGGKGMAIAGIICSALALVVALLVFTLGTLLFTTFVTMF